MNETTGKAPADVEDGGGKIRADPPDERAALKPNEQENEGSDDDYEPLLSPPKIQSHSGKNFSEENTQVYVTSICRVCSGSQEGECSGGT